MYALGWCSQNIVHKIKLKSENFNLIGFAEGSSMKVNNCSFLLLLSNENL